MFQIDNSSTVTQMPSPSAAGIPGFFTDGNPATGQAATILPAEFMNMLMMELMSVVQAGNITPDKTKTNQVLSALNAIFAKLAGSSSQAFNVANASQASHAVALGQFANLLQGNGSQNFPGGLILKWGRQQGPSGSVQTDTVVYPLAFPNGALFGGFFFETASVAGLQYAVPGQANMPVGLAGSGCYFNSSYYRWFVFGY